MILQYTFNVALLSIFGKDEVKYREDLKRCYYILEKGYNSMPINLPGTLFNKSMKARKELAQILAQIISTRREMKKDHQDLLASFMGDKEGLTDEQIADNVIGVIFAARDTTASVLTWIIKYLADNPSVLQSVTVYMYIYLSIILENCINVLLNQSFNFFFVTISTFSQYQRISEPISIYRRESLFCCSNF